MREVIAASASTSSSAHAIRHAVITGGSSGIGLALARRLARQGTRLTLLARDAGKLAAVAAEIQEEHPTLPSVFVSSTDVTQQTEVETALADAIAAHGPVDLLITSAGQALAQTFEATPIDQFEQLMAVNYFGSLYPLKTLLPAMRSQGHGHAVLISSGTGLFGLFGYSAYGASKFALRGLAESLEAEYRGTGVGIHIAYPPDTDTPQLAAENATKPPETKAITAGAGLWSADAVAEHILRKVAAGSFCITPGFPLTALAWGHSLIAPILRWHFHRIARRAARR